MSLRQNARMPSDAEIIREFIRRQRGSKTPTDGLFERQRLFHRDPARFKAALNTRRSGKSFLAATRLILAATRTQASTNPYVALTRDSAKRILWPILLTIIEKYEIKATPVESTLTIEFPQNKSQVFLVGADQKNFINRLRGIAAKLAVIDEAQSYREHIKELIDDVLTPALADHNGGLDLYGTPGIRPNGFFYDVTTQNIGFSVHRWSILDNPHIPNAPEFISEMMKRRGWSEQNPTYRREWLGEWVLDEDSLLFKFNEHRNLISEIDTKNLIRIIGIDFGFHDKTAFVIVSFDPHSPKLYVEHSEAYSEMIPSEIAKHTELLVQRFNPVSIVSDSAGLGKSILEEMRRRYHLPVKAAQKTDKLTAISLINGEFIESHVKVLASNKEFIHQLKNTPRGEKGIEDDGSPFDLCDAFIYAFREAKQWAWESKKAKIDPNSEEFILLGLEKEAERAQHKQWWEQYDGD